MGTSGPSSEHALDEALSVFAQRDTSGTPLTTSEVADALGCTPRTATDRLEELVGQGESDRVWWRPNERPVELESGTQSGLEQAQFYELVESVSDYAIFVLDADGIVQTWNDGARQLKGYGEDEIVGEHFSTFYTEDEIVGEHFSTFYTEDDREAGRPDRNLATAVEEGRLEDECEAMFETGYTTAAEQGGTGLGLAFVKELAEIYEWECSVTESEAGGAQFEFTNVERNSA